MRAAPARMTETTENPKPADPVLPPWRWPRRLAILLAVLLGLYLCLPIFVWMCQRLALDEDAPRIAFSPNDTWLRALHINQTYKGAFILAGARLVEMRPSDTGADLRRITKWLKENEIDGVLLAGGGDVDPQLYGGDHALANDVNRKRDDFEIALIQVAVKKKLPILGICRGAQILNIARGGTLRDLRTNPTLRERHFTGNGHPVNLVSGSRLAGLLRTSRLGRVKTWHLQAVEKPGRGLRVSAKGPGGVVEAIEGTSTDNPWIVAVQWHPELSVIDRYQKRLLRAFVKAARTR